jgi:GT2 family glycosyltransferase
MTISLILPVYNGGQLLAEAAASVLGQTRPPDEFLLVDDGSTDGVAEALARSNPGILYLRQPNGGAASARNLGLARAKGELRAFLDSDDLWPPDSLAANLQCLEENPAAQAVMGRMRVFRPRPDGGFEPTDFVRHTLHLGASLFRRQAFERVGNLDTTLRHTDDLDWFLRARHLGVSVQLHDAITYHYRHHQNGLTGNADARRAGHVEAVRGALLRQRAAASSPRP